MPSFDLVSKVDIQTLDNAINVVNKEITNRFDFKDAHVLIELNKKEFKKLIKEFRALKNKKSETAHKKSLQLEENRKVGYRLQDSYTGYKNEYQFEIFKRHYDVVDLPNLKSLENINEVAGLIQRLVPDARIQVGHGRLEGKKLEQLMLDFMQGSFDVLVSTTIVESGLDVPNANTIFINNANNFGLSDLHQMRGRVGRTNKKAYCYFITPDYSTMTDDARKRIIALEQHTELGSGFNIAMKDLEIRGAGDLLGGEQSGFINDMGFETYQKILNETIEDLKQNEFKELYQDEKTKKYINEVSIDTDFELLFPDSYIKSVNERLQLYSELNKISNIDKLFSFESMLKDRFGNLPFQVEDLLVTVKLKWIAIELGFEKVVMKKQIIKAYFIKDKNSDYFKSDIFTSILNYVNLNPNTCKLEEKKSLNGSKLVLTIRRINTIESALLALEAIKN